MNDTVSSINVRAVAAMVLSEVLNHSKTIDESLLSVKYYNKLDARDKGFVRFMVANALRCLPSIDNLISQYCKKAPPHFVQNLLRIAVSQLSVGTEPYAAVYETVSASPPKFRGFINAVLRNITKKELDVKPSIVGWVYDSWVAQYGLEIAGKISDANSKRADLDFTVKPSFKDKIGGTPITQYTHRFPSDTQITSMAGFMEGEFWVQDVSATIPCLAAGNVENKSVIDLCSAPGGKSFLLKMLGAKLVSVDSSPDRMAILLENAKRLKYDFPVIVSDVLNLDTKIKYDVALLDALCSGTGTIRRHPELPYIKKESNIIQLVAQQKNLLDKAAQLVKEGGILIYSVCSIDKREGSLLIDEFLKNNGNFELEQIELPFKLDREITTKYIQLFPFDLGGMDGFFIARLRKIA